MTTRKIVLLRAALPVKCPACGTHVPWQTVTDVAFPCSSCGSRIQLKRSYFHVFSLISFPIAGLVAYALGSQGNLLYWCTLLGGFPVGFLIMFLTMRLIPAEAELGDYPSILHSVDPVAVERARHNRERDDDSDT